MKRSIVIFSLFLLPSAALQAQSNDANASDVKACAALAQAGQLPWSVNSAEFVLPPFTTPVSISGPQVTVAVSFCRVIGTVKPTPESDIRFELWLPPRATGQWRLTRLNRIQQPNARAGTGLCHGSYR